MRLAIHGVLIAVVLTTAACGSWFDEKNFSPSSPSVVDALTLTRDPASIPADGFSTALVTATLSADAVLAHRTVVFTTTVGTLVGSTDPEGHTLERTVNLSTASATVELRSSRTVETARVTATVRDVAGLGREVLVNFTAPTPSDIITVSAGVTSAPADGATLTPVTAQISGALPAGRRTVTFTTTAGLFVGDPAVADGSPAPTIKWDADSGNKATVYLRSPGDAVGVGFITASVDSDPAVSASTQVQFTRALAQRLLVTVDKASLPQDDTSSVKVTVTLVREPGVPTQGAIVTYRAVDAGGVERGLFTNIRRSDANGEATADLTPGLLAAPGTMTITVSADGLTASTKIQITVP